MIYEERDGKLYARVVFTDETGKRREKQTRVANKKEAREILKQMLRDLEDFNSSILSSSAMLFKDLADHVIANYFKEAEYRNNIKISGHRSHKKTQGHFQPVVNYFGNKLLRSIKWADIAHYKNHRLKTITRCGTARSSATVNRELGILRRALEIAKQQGWIKQNPFTQGDALICVADEQKRERILTKDEELHLLEACKGKKAHIKAILIFAIDTGMRAGEIFTLKWQDVDFHKSLINVQAFNTKTMQSRQVAMTNRLEKELWDLWALSGATGNVADQLVFGIKTSCKHGFDNLRKECNLKDLRFHDLRHTCASRLIAGGMAIAEVARILGHSQISTTFRYVNINAETATKAADILNKLNSA